MPTNKKFKVPLLTGCQQWDFFLCRGLCNLLVFNKRHTHRFAFLRGHYRDAVGYALVAFVEKALSSAFYSSVNAIVCRGKIFGTLKERFSFLL